jgi:hypothetical protein
VIVQDLGVPAGRRTKPTRQPTKKERRCGRKGKKQIGKKERAALKKLVKFDRSEVKWERGGEQERRRSMDCARATWKGEAFLP